MKAAVAVLIVMGVLGAALAGYALITLDPLNQIATRLPDGGIQFKGDKIDGTLLNYIQRGPQSGNATWERWFMAVDGYPTAAWRMADTRMPTAQFRGRPISLPTTRDVTRGLDAIGKVLDGTWQWLVGTVRGILSFDWLVANASAARFLVSSGAGCTITTIATDLDCWSASSGGAGGASIPTVGDAVTVNASSGANEVKQDGVMSFDSLTFTNSPLTGTGWNTNGFGLTISGACTTSAGTGTTVSISTSTMSVGGDFNKCHSGSLTAVLNLTGTGIYGATDAGGGLIDGTINITGGTRTMGDFMQAKKIIITATLDTGGKLVYITGGGSPSILQIGAGGTLTANASTITMGTGGNGADWDSSNATATFTQGTSTVEFTETSSITMLAADNDFNLLTVSGGTVTLASAVDVGSTLTISGGSLAKATFTLTAIALTMSGGDLTSTSGAVTVSGAVNISSAASAIDFGSETWTVSGAWTNASTDGAVWDAGAGTMIFDAGGATTVTFAGTNLSEDEFNNVTFNSTAAMTYTMATRGLRLGGLLNITDTVTTVALTTSGSNLAITAGTVTVGTNGTLTANASTITVSGNWNSSAGTFTYGTSTVVFAATGSVSVNTGSLSAASFYNATVNAGVTTTFNSAMSFLNVFTLNGIATASSLYQLGLGFGSTQVTPLVFGGSGAFGGSLGVEFLPAVNYNIPGGTYVELSVRGWVAATTGTAQGNILVTGYGAYNGGTFSVLVGAAAAIATATFDLNGFSLTLTAPTNLLNFNVSGNRGVLLAGSSVVSVGSVSIVTGGGGIVPYITSTAGGSWTVSGAWTNNSTSASWSFAAPITFTSATGGTMTFAGANLPGNEFNNVTFTSSAGTAQTFTMATRGLTYGGTLTVSDTSSTTALATANLALTGGALVVGNGGILTANASTVSVSSVTMTGGTNGTIIITTGAWTVSAGMNTSGAGSTFTEGTTSTYVFSGTGALTMLSTDNTLTTVTVSGGTVSQGSAIVVDRVLTLSGGTLAKGTNALTVTNSQAAATGLTMSGGDLTSTSGTVSITGAVNISSAVSAITFGSEAWTVTGAWSNASTDNAVWNAGSGSITFTSATGDTMTFGGANLNENEFNNITFTSSAGVPQTFTMATRSLLWAGLLTISDGVSTTTLDTASLGLTNLTQTPAVTVGAGGVLTANASTITIAGNWSSSAGTFNIGTSTVIFAFTASIASATTSSFYNLEVNGGTVSPLNNIDVNNILTLSGGTYAKGTTALNVDVNLVMSGGDLTATSGTVTVTGNVTISATSAISFGSASWSVAGSWTNASTDGAVWDAGTGSISFTSSSNQTMTFAGTNLAEDEFATATFNASGAAAVVFGMATRGLRIGALNVQDTVGGGSTTLDTNSLGLDINGNLTVGTGGILTLDASAVTCSGSSVDINGTLNAATSTFTLDGTNQTVSSGGATWATLNMQTSGSIKTFDENYGVGSGTVSAGVTWALSDGVTLTVTNGSIITMNGSLDWNGDALIIVVRSGGAAWSLNASSRQVVFFVNAANSNASGGSQIEDCVGGVDSGGNVNWAFAGSLDCGEGITPPYLEIPGNAGFSCTHIFLRLVCKDESKYTGKEVIARVEWWYNGKLLATSGPGQWVLLAIGDDISNWGDAKVQITMRIVYSSQTEGGPTVVREIALNNWTKPLFLFVGLALILYMGRAVSRAATVSAGPRPRNPGYRRTAISVEEYPAGWTSYRQRTPEQYKGKFVSKRMTIDGKKVWVVYGLKPATPVQRRRTGRKWVSEIQTVREKGNE